MKKKILIIDDEFNSRTLMAQILQDEGYSVDRAENGISALKTLENEPFSVVITDIRMPTMDGKSYFIKLKSSILTCQLYFLPPTIPSMLQ